LITPPSCSIHLNCNLALTKIDLDWLFIYAFKYDHLHQTNNSSWHTLDLVWLFSYSRQAI
jgi:hypothetical protein